MNFDQPKKEIIKTPEVKIKEGVDFVFEQNPELKQIGTKEQYSEYLDSVFPNSKVKDIIYHSTNDKFDTFDKSKIGSAVDNIVKTKAGNPFDAFYFAPDTNYHKDNPYKISNLISVTVNIERLFQEHQSVVEKQIAYSNNAKLGYANPIKKENDGTIFYADDGKPIQVLVFEPENIHILGSKQDIENFKEFVCKSKPVKATV